MSVNDSRTILLVEDEAILAMAEKLALEKYGYTVITESTGESAVDAVKSTVEISLILMDIDLGNGIDGTEAASIILKERDIPIVFVSSHSEREIVEKTEKITSYGYVVKNSSITVLDASIKMAFRLFEASRKIANSELKQKTMIANISDVIGIVGADGTIQYISPNIERWFGWKPEELIGTDGWLTVHPDDLERVQKIFHSLLDTENSSQEAEYRYKFKDGSYKPIHLTAVNLVDDPVINGILVNYHDISERKQVEMDIQTKNEELKAVNEALVGEKIFTEGLLECLPGYLYVYNDQGALIRWNKKHETMTGFTGEELSRKNLSDWFEGEDALRVAAAVETVFRTGYGEVEANLLINGGKKLLIHSNGVKLTIDGKSYFVGVGIDITERKRAEDAIRETNTLLRIAETTAKLGGWSVNLESNQVIWSDEVAIIHEETPGYSPLIQDAIDYYASEWRGRILKCFNACSQNGVPYDEEMEIITARGKRVWVRTIGEALKNDEGKIYIVQGAIQDITEQKKAEAGLRSKNEEYSALNEELRSSVEELRAATEELQAQNEELQVSYESIRQGEARYSSLLSNLEAGVVVHAPDTSIIMTNERACVLLGLSGDQMKGKKAIDPAWKFVHADTTPLPLSEYPVNRIAAGKKPVKAQIVGVCHNGNSAIVWLSVNGFPVLDKSGALAEILISLTDITERKKAEEELKRIEWLLTSKPQIHDAKKEGYIPPYGDLVALNTSRLILDSVGEQTLNDIAGDYLNLLDTSSAIYEKNGDYALGLFSSGWCRFMDAASRALCLAGDNRKALDCGKWHCHESCWSRASKTAIETGLPADIECDGGIRLYAVPIHLGGEIIGAINFGYGDPPRDERKLRELADRYRVGYEELRERAMSYETRPPYIIDLAKQRLSTSARLIGDIVGRKRAEAETRALLAEKELILKEVNHRVKNNMNTMKGLLRLQAGKAGDAQTAAALEDAGNRMQSMEILYEQLYHTTSFSELSVNIYISPLVDAVIANFPQGNKVRIEKHIDEFILDAKRLQPLGIIMNELLTNAMKYAFTDKSKGIITVAVGLAEGHISVMVQDNGTGIPASVDFDNSTGFGLTLVQALASQLGGTVRIEREGGTRIVLVFDK